MISLTTSSSSNLGNNNSIYLGLLNTVLLSTYEINISYADLALLKGKFPVYKALKLPCIISTQIYGRRPFI